jgi:hypothetical protein
LYAATKRVTYHCHLLQDVCCVCNVALRLLHSGKPARQPGTLNLYKDLQQDRTAWAQQG